MKNKKKKWILHAIFFISITLALISGLTLTWIHMSQQAKAELRTDDPTFQVELLKLEKLPDGTLTENLIPGARFYLFGKGGGQIGKMFTTDSQGRINVSLPVGDYYFEEVYPGDNYGFDEENGKPKVRYPFRVEETSQAVAATVKAYNIPLFGDLTIKKTVQNADGAPLTATQQDTLFEFKVTFSDNGSYSCTIDDGEPQIVKSGSFIYLKHGQTAVFADVPMGVSYRVEETRREEYTISSTGHRGTMTDKGATAEFINTFSNITSGLVVTKIVQGADADIRKPFEFTAVINGETTVFQLCHGESKSFPNLPLGTEYTITESDYSAHGYTAAVSSYQGAIQGTETTVLPFVNAYQAPQLPGDLVVRKFVRGGAPDPEQLFHFQIEWIGDHDLQTPQTFTLRAGEEKVFENVPAGVQYVVTETDTGDYLPVVETIRGNIVGQNIVYADFINQKQPVPEEGFGDLVVTKEVLGGDEAARQKEFSFKAVLNGKEFPFTLKHGQSKRFVKVPVGTEYVVTEADYSGEGFLTPVPEYRGVIAGKEATVLPFRNVLGASQEPGTLIVEKQVPGENPDPEQLFGFTIRFEGEGEGLPETPQVFQLKAGERKVFEHVPAGTRYTVKETDFGDFTPTTDTMTGRVVGAQENLVTFTNTWQAIKPPKPPKYGSLVVTKDVPDKGAEAEREFEFVIELDGKISRFTLSHRESKKFIDLPIGTKYTVTELDYSSDGFVTEIDTYSGIITGTEQVTLPFVNRRHTSPHNGSLTVEKQVIGEHADPEKQFTFKVEFEGENAPESPQFFTLRAGERKLLDQLPAGVRFKVTEVDSADYLPGTEFVKGTIVGAQNVQAVFVNRVPEPVPPLPPEQAGKIMVSKTVEGEGADPNKPFEFTAVFDGQTYKFVLKHGETKEFANLPFGTEYTITESDYTNEGYVTPIPSYEGVVRTPYTRNASFLNVLNPPNYPGEITVEKRVVGEEPDPLREFEFEAVFSNESGIINRETFRLRAGHKKVFTNIAPYTKYTITEIDSAGYTPLIDRIDGIMVGGQRVTYVFTNEVVPDPVPDKGMLIVTKQVEGAQADYEKPFHFVGEIGGQRVEFDLKHGERKVFEDVPIGTEYRFTEQDYTAEGYHTPNSSYVGVVRVPEPMQLPFTNIFGDAPPQASGNLLIEKRVPGNNPTPNLDFSFEVHFSGENAPQSPQRFTLKAGETKLFENVPAGVRFTVYETNAAGYLPQVEMMSGVIVADQTVTTCFINEVPPAKPFPPDAVGSLEVKKEVQGKGADFTKEFEFTLSIGGKTQRFRLRHGQTKVFDNIPLGTDYTVVEKDYTADGYHTFVNRYEGVVTSPSKTKLVFTNHYEYVESLPNTGDLLVKKTVEGVVEPDREFEFDIVFTGKEGLPPPQRFRLKNGEVKLFKNIPAGTQYLVTELDNPGYYPVTKEISGLIIENELIEAEFVNVDANLPQGNGNLVVRKEVSGLGADFTKEFNFKATINGELHKFTLRHGQTKVFADLPVGTQFTIEEADYSFEGYTPAVRVYKGTIAREGDNQVVFVNYYEDPPYDTGDLVIEKIVEGEAANPDQEFVFEIVFDELNIPIPSPQSFTLKGGEKKVFNNLPAGTKYIITETDAGDYLPMTKEASGTIRKNEEIYVPFVNVAQAKPPVLPPTHGSLRVEKEVRGEPLDTQKEFTFTAAIGDEPPIEFVLRHGESKEFPELPIGTRFTVTERDYSNDGYTTAVNSYTGTITSGHQVILPFLNVLNASPDAPGSLTVEKRVVGDESDPNRVFRFEVEFTGAGAPESPQSFTLKAGERKEFPELAPGVAYTIREVDSAGYSTPVPEVQGVVVGGENVLVPITNEVVPPAPPPPIVYGSLRVEKEVRGDPLDADKQFTFTAQLFGESIEFTLRHGESKVFPDLPVGTEFTITEHDYSTEGYVTAVKSYTGTITSENEVRLPFLNVLNPPLDALGNLTVEKQVVGVGADPEREFSFEVTFTGEGAPDSPQQFTLKAGQRKEFLNIKPGVSFVVRELNSGGYTTPVPQVEGVVIAGENVIVPIVNEVALLPPPPPVYGALKVRKEVRGETADPDQAFEFEGTINGQPVRFTLKNGEVKEFPRLPRGSKYVITEHNYTELGYVTAVKTYEGMITGETPTELVFVNVHNPPLDMPGSVIVEKQLAGPYGSPEQEFTFEIVYEGADAPPPEIFTLKPGQKKEIPNLPAGVTYTIRETDNAGYLPSMESVNGTVIGGQINEHLFVNERLTPIPPVLPDTGSLTIEKKVTGRGADFEKPFEFTVEIGGEIHTISLKHGEKHTFPDLPIGTEYRVTEQDYSAESYVTAVQSFAGVIAKPEEHLVLFENYHKAPVTPPGYPAGDLIIEKEVPRTNGNPDQEFTFEIVFEGEGAPESPQRFTLKDGERKVFANLPAGLKYTVTEISYGDYLPVFTQASGVIVQDEVIVVTFVNADPSEAPLPDDRGGLIVSKEVRGKGADREKEFEFTLDLNGEQHTFVLKHGERLEIPDLPIGTRYTVTERDYSAEGYVTEVQSYSGVITQKRWGELPFVNYYRPLQNPVENVGELIVAKNVIGNNPDPNKEFTFEIVFEGPNAPKSQIFKLKHGEIKVFRNLPAGIKYTIREIDSAGYLPVVKEVGGIITKNEVSFAEFINAVPTVPPPGPEVTSSLVVTKEVKGRGADFNKDFEFRVRLNGEEYVFSLKHGESFEIPNLPIGTEYEVVETNYTADGYIASVSKYSGVIIDGQKVVLPFVNYYKEVSKPVENTGDLIVSKEVPGYNPDPDQEFTFTISFEGEGAPDSPQTFVLKAGEMKIFKNIPSGVSYRIEEIKFGNYLPTTLEVSGIVIKDETIFIPFKNVPRPTGPPSPEDVGTLVVTKQVYGKPVDVNKEFEFIVTIDGKEHRFTLKHGQSMEFPNLPIGTEYTVIEKSYVDDHYYTTVGAYRGVITGRETVETLFKNYYQKPEVSLDTMGSLIVDKQVIGEMPDPNQEFTFEITFEGEGAPAPIIFTLKAGEQREFPNIPQGVKYTVREINSGGYFPSIEQAVGTIVAGEKAFVQFINSREEMPKLKLTKRVEGRFPPEALEQRYQFSIVLDGKRYKLTLKPGEDLEFALPAGTDYEVVEDGVPNGLYYQSIENGFGTLVSGTTNVIITNTFIDDNEVIISGTKSWDLAGYPDTVKPEFIVVRLMHGKLLVEEKIVKVNANGEWSYSFKAPKYDANGNEIKYTIEEVPLDDFIPTYDGYNITNKYIPPVVVDPPIIEKIIKGENYPDTKFSFLMIGQEGAPMPEGSTGNKKIISLNNAGAVEIGNITFTKPGVYQYKLFEVNNAKDGWIYDNAVYILTITVVEQDGKLVARKMLTKVGESETVHQAAAFTNIYVPGLEHIATVSGEKRWHHGSNPPENRPKQIVVLVYADGKLLVQKQVTVGDDWKYSFDLPKYDDNGREIEYTIDEKPVPGYDKVIDGFNITNIYQDGSAGGSSSSSDITGGAGASSSSTGGTGGASSSDPTGGGADSSDPVGGGSTDSSDPTGGGSAGGHKPGAGGGSQNGGHDGTGDGANEANGDKTPGSGSSKPGAGGGRRPTTGDPTQLGLWVILMLSSGVALVTVYFIRKK